MIEAMVGFVVLCAAGLSAAEPDYISGRAFAAMKDGARAVADLRNAADTILYDDNTKGLALIALGRAYRDLLKDDTGALAAFRETCATSFGQALRGSP